MSRATFATMVFASSLLAAGALGAGDKQSPASFVEEFSAGGVDHDRWLVSDGWSNGSWHGCTWMADNVTFAEGGLRLVIDPATESKAEGYDCGELQSHDYYGYGTYEVRLRPARAPGIVTGFFVYTGPPHGNPHDEIDVELPGARIGTVELNNWVGGVGAEDKAVELGFDTSEGMNDYAFVWTPEAIRWYVNGTIAREVTAPERIPHTPGKIYVSLFNGTAELDDWLGTFTYGGAPLQTEVERVAYTRPGDPCQFAESIVCRRDEPD